jgi:hypothetical protein
VQHRTHRLRAEPNGEQWVFPVNIPGEIPVSNDKDRAPPRKQRPVILAERRNAKMARSAHAYMRGNTVKFYEWLETAAGKSLPEGPPVWI